MPIERIVCLRWIREGGRIPSGGKDLLMFPGRAALMVQRSSPLLNTRWHRMCLLSGFDDREYGEEKIKIGCVIWERHTVGSYRDLLMETPVLHDLCGCLIENTINATIWQRQRCAELTRRRFCMTFMFFRNLDVQPVQRPLYVLSAQTFQGSRCMLLGESGCTQAVRRIIMSYQGLSWHE